LKTCIKHKTLVSVAYTIFVPNTLHFGNEKHVSSHRMCTETRVTCLLLLAGCPM